MTETTAYNRPPNCTTPTGMVHAGRWAKNPWSGEFELYPRCMSGSTRLRAGGTTQKPVTCKRCAGYDRSR